MIKLHKIALVFQSECDVLIYDSVGKTLLDTILPEGVATQSISLRETYPIVCRVGFLWELLKIVFRKRSRDNRLLVDKYLDVLIKELSPKVIVSLADSNKEILRYAARYTDTKLVLIQNAIRASHRDCFSVPCNLSYCSLGKVEEKRQQAIGHKIIGVTPIGSLTLGAALQTINQVPAFPWADLGFISSFRTVSQRDDSAIGLQFENMHQKLFSYIAAFAKQGNYSLRVIAKSKLVSEQVLEREFFEQLAEGQDFDFVTSLRTERELNSYYGALATELIITAHSTLGFEMLALGRKVLFGSPMSNDYIYRLGIDDYFAHLPSIVKIEKEEFKEFCTKANQLYKEDGETFSLGILPFSRCVVSMLDNRLPQEVVRNIILERLGRSTVC